MIFDLASLRRLHLAEFANSVDPHGLGLWPAPSFCAQLGLCRLL